MSDIERAVRAAREEREAHRREKAARRGAAARRAAPSSRPAAEAASVTDSPVPARSPLADAGATPLPPSSVAGGGRPVPASPVDPFALPESGRTSGFGASEPRRPSGRAGRRSGSPSGRTVSLPLERLARQGFVTPSLPKGRLSEEYRRVKRPILRTIADGAGDGGHPNIVAVTSSVAGEGKTYTAINLAMSLAMERERTVLLIDADVLKGTAGRILGVESDSPGLTDVLSNDDADLADVILGTDVPNLRLVPAGKPTDRATELLSSVRMRELVDELAARYADRIIVLDCPPMLQTNEANVIVEHAGQVVFVVAAQETDQRLTLEAMSQFEVDRSVSILLNKARAKGADYYDYGYGHG